MNRIDRLISGPYKSEEAAKKPPPKKLPYDQRRVADRANAEEKLRTMDRVKLVPREDGKVEAKLPDRNRGFDNGAKVWVDPEITDIDEAGCIRPGWVKPFLIHLAETGNVEKARQAAGIGLRTLYDYRASSPTFHLAWLDAIEISIQNLEYAARERAMAGKSDLLTIFLLKALRPSVYRDNYQQGGVNISGKNVQVNLRSLPDKDLEQLERILTKNDSIEDQRRRVGQAEVVEVAAEPVGNEK